jgi:hypothetical protein
VVLLWVLAGCGIRLRRGGELPVPEIDVGVGQDFAGVDINELDVKEELNSVLVLSDVLADELAGDVVRSDS